MLFSEQDAPHLKKWIVKRLEDTSDADADVLADYVLALLRHDGKIDTVRRLCEEEIPDFVKEDSSVFVRDVFDAIKFKSYMPGAPPAPKSFLPTLPPSNLPTSAMSGQSYDIDAFMTNAPRGPQNGSRKRSYGDSGDLDTMSGRSDQVGDVNGRLFKQPRRSNSTSRAGRFDSYGGARGGRQVQPLPLNTSHLPASGFATLPQMPTPPPGMPPIDPNNPLAAMLTMQAMGFPLPGMPSYQPTDSPAMPSNVTRTRISSTGKRQRCRDYDTKGFCARGNTCLFEHGSDSIYVQPTTMDEYDPANSALIPGIEATPRPIMTAPLPSSLESFRGNDRGRGRGRGFQGDRGGSNGAAPSRRGGRAEFSSDRPNFDRTKTTIVVENIPEEVFLEESVREFFSEFGAIREVTMKPYKRLALVKYEDWTSAKAAYSSPKVIFDNRFVKVYWYTNNESLPRAPPASGATKNGAAEHKNGSPTTEERKPSEPLVDIEEITRKQVEFQKAHEEKSKKKAEMEAAQKDLEKRQEALLKKQAEEKRKLMEKLAARTTKSATSPSGDQNGTSPAASVTPGSQTELLKAQLAALEAEAKSLGLDTALTDDATWNSRGRGRGRGSYRGRATFVPRGRGFDRGGYRGRGGAPFGGAGAVYKLDNRPKKISVTGVDFTIPDKDENLRLFLLGIGEYTDLDATPEKTSITFKDRFTAEKFMYGLNNGEIPSVGKVELGWVQTPLPPVILNRPAVTHKSESIEVIQIEEGDATMQDVGQVQGGGQGQEQQQELDYDIADDNDWGQ